MSDQVGPRVGLPEDVGAFVAEVEAYLTNIKTTLKSLNYAETTALRLLAIIRAHGAELSERAASEQGIIDAAMKARFDLEAIAEENKALADRLAKLEKALGEACDGWEDALQYKGEFLAKKHGDAESIAELRELVKGSNDGR